MKYQLVQTKNLLRLHAAMVELTQRGEGIPGLGLLFGKTGAGKTTALASVVAKTRAVAIRANAATSLNSLLDDICFELKVEGRLGRATEKFRLICEAMKDKPRPIFIDEADYLCRGERMLDILRDVHDLTGIPVLLVGMAGLEGRLVHLKQLARRISMKIEFEPCDQEDTRLVADTLCEVGIAEDLLRLIHERSHGCIGLMVVALARVESFAREQRMAEISAAAWGKRELFLGSERAE